MKIIRSAAAFLVLIVFVFSAFGQTDFAPKKIKPFDPKDLKNKVLLIPYIEKIPEANKDMSTFKGFNTATKLEEEWKRRVEEAYKLSTFDLLEMKVDKFNPDELKKNNDKSSVSLYFEKDFYGNIYVFLAVADPKWEIIATAPVNGMVISEIEGFKLMLNMLHYSLITACSYYGDNAKPMYRGHENKYQKVLEGMSDNLKSLNFTVVKYEKEVKGFAKKNEKNAEFLKIKWKFSGYELITQKDLDQRLVTGYNGFYLKSIPIYTANPKIDYQYVVFLTGDNQDVLYTYLSPTDLKPANLAYIQPRLEEWFVVHMTAKQRKTYEEQKARSGTQVPQKSSKSAPVKPTPAKTSPTKPAPAKTPPAKPAPKPTAPKPQEGKPR